MQSTRGQELLERASFARDAGHEEEGGGRGVAEAKSGIRTSFLGASLYVLELLPKRKESEGSCYGRGGE